MPTCVIRPPTPSERPDRGTQPFFSSWSPFLRITYTVSKDQSLEHCLANARVKSPLTKDLSATKTTRLVKSSRQAPAPWGCEPWGSQGPGLKSPLGPARGPESPPTSHPVQHLRVRGRSWSHNCQGRSVTGELTLRHRGRGAWTVSGRLNETHEAPPSAS